jgi:hypothetical protein
MARAHGCDLRAVLAGAIICWAAAEGIAVAQNAAEVTEELGNSYLLARRTTDQRSIIETLLYEGQAIVTDIAVPTPDGGVTAAATGAAAATPDGSANALPGGGASLPPGLGPGFGGTWLTGEIIGDYLVLHRIRASSPVAHEIFYLGRKVGSVTEISPSSREGRSAGRSSFAFESTDDRFVVHLTQPDGTRIHATTEHGRFLGQTVERSAALQSPPRSGVGIAAPPSVNAPPPAAAAAPRPAAPASAVTAPAVKPKPAVAAVSAEPPAAKATKPLAPASAAAQPKPGRAAETGRAPSRAAAKPVTPAARPSRSPPSDSKSGT